MREKIITPEDEAARMVREHVAPNIPQALGMLEEISRRAKNFDLLILYTDANVVRYVFNAGIFVDKLFNEQPYMEDVRAAFIPSGILGSQAFKDQPIVFGRIIELVAKDGESAQLIAIIDNFRFNGRKSVLFSNKSALEIREKGSKTFEQIHPEMKLFRWEVSPEEDFICAIFKAWNAHPVSQEFALVLFMPKNKTAMFP
ncbi:MAG: hypothetical protein PHQ42_03045 [Patescibacteria group bacterium]|nr:hypothetical protein [Patescibacteria group bacterium]